MKKLSLLIVILLVVNAVVTAQDSGIRFQNAASWQEVLDKAKQENKYIFVDCYATWCGPCKFMDKNIFPDKEVGQFFNEKFIAVKIQMDKTKEDVAFVQSWYKDATSLEKEYSVQAFPTYLFFSPKGEPLHRFSGGSKTGAEFIAKSRQALNPATQYYTNVVKYKDHLGDSAFLRNAIKVALGVNDRKMAAEIGDHYLDAVNPMLKENLLVIRTVTMSTKNKGYEVITKNQAKVDSIMGANTVSLIASTILYGEDLKPYFEEGKELKKWSRLARKLKKKYYMVNPRVVDQYEAGYYRAKNNIPAFEKALVRFMKTYGNTFGDVPFNENAWSVFLLSDNKEVLETALGWSQRALELVPKEPGSNYSNYMDTYASLLYKLGRKDEAITWQKKAIVEAEKKSVEKLIVAMKKTLAKMENGEKTW